MKAHSSTLSRTISKWAIATAAAFLLFHVARIEVYAGKKPTDGVQILQLSDRLRIAINGALFTEYFYTNVPRPFCYPLNSPEGLGMTRNWPAKDVPNEEHDHPHHHSFWLGHGSVNGHDFWREIKDSGTIVHRGFDEIKSGKDFGVIKARHDWVAADGKVICTDEQTLRIFAGKDQQRWLDFEITLHASNGDIKLGSTKEGMMAVRLAETMRLKPNKDNVGKPTGHIVTSEGIRDEATWGKRAAWCDYSGPVDGKILGIAIFDHPQNPRYPTWWMVRDYGLFAANPFGQHEFENTPDKTDGDFAIASGKDVTFRYRLYFHEGDEKQGKVAKRYGEFLKSISAKHSQK